MCDNCKCACIDCEIKQRALNEQRRIIDELLEVLRWLDAEMDCRDEVRK